MVTFPTSPINGQVYSPGAPLPDYIYNATQGVWQTAATATGPGLSNYLASPGAIGSTTPSSGAFTTLAASGAVSGAGFTALRGQAAFVTPTGGGATTTFVGSGTPANFWESSVLTASNSAVPEITAQFSITSNTGLANHDSAYKIGLTASALGGPSSADVYGFNVITQGYGGTHLVTGFETDVNNIGADAINIAGPTSVYGAVAVAAGTAKSTAGLWVIASSGGSWTHGVMVSQANIASFNEGSTASIGLAIHGAHATGIDMLAGYPISVAIALPNNSPIQQKDASGTLRNLLNTDTSSNMIIGDSGGGAIMALNTLRPFGDNATSLGLSGSRWSAVWAANGTIQTSDVRQKTDIAQLPSTLSLMKDINPITFRWASGGKTIVETTEEKEVPETEQVTQEVEEVKIVDGKAVREIVSKTREHPVYDEYPVFDDAGEPVMDGKPGQKAQRIHRVQRMVTKQVPATKYVDKPGSRIHWGFAAQDVKAAFDKFGMDFGGYIKDEDGTEGLRPDQLIPVLWKAVQELAADFEAYKAAHPKTV